ADVFLESFRPGVAERLGVGPEVVLSGNPRIVYGRLSGYGQNGPLARRAGHSLTYEALAGLTRAVGPPGSPVPILQVVGDVGAGAMHLAFGVACALLHARATGQGQVIDVSMTESVMSLAAVYYPMAAGGMHTAARGDNIFDGGAPYYAVY